MRRRREIGSVQARQVPSALILQAVRLYLRFTPGIRDAENLIAERGVEVRREAIQYSIDLLPKYWTGFSGAGQASATVRMVINEGGWSDLCHDRYSDQLYRSERRAIDGAGISTGAQGE